jgi:hypothetical protein
MTNFRVLVVEAANYSRPIFLQEFILTVATLTF